MHTIDKDNKKQIAINKQRAENLQLLEPIAPAVKKPFEVYKYTLDKAIKSADVKEEDDSKLFITTSKINYSDLYTQEFEEDNICENKPKLKVKGFKLK